MTKRTKRIWLIAGGVALLVVVLVGFLVWWFVFRDDSPPPPDIETQSEVIAEEQNLDETATPTDEPTPTATADPTEEADEPTTTTTEPAAALDGTWVVDHSLGSFDDFTSSYAGYRVQEELANIGANTAVGRTPEVTGEIVIDGTSITSAEILVDMATLQSDSGFRDGRVRSTLDVDQFPTASFVLTTPIVFSDIPAEGELLTIQASGDFTAHGVTNPVTVDLEARLVGEVIVVVGSFEISFDDYDVTAPSAPAVISVEDEATVEWQLNLIRQA